MDVSCTISGFLRLALTGTSIYPSKSVSSSIEVLIDVFPSLSSSIHSSLRSRHERISSRLIGALTLKSLSGDEKRPVP